MSRSDRYDDEFLQESPQWYAPGPPEPSDTEIVIDVEEKDLDAVAHELSVLYQNGMHIDYSFNTPGVSIETETREDLETALQHLRDKLGLTI